MSDRQSVLETCLWLVPGSPEKEVSTFETPQELFTGQTGGKDEGRKALSWQAVKQKVPEFEWKAAEGTFFRPLASDPIAKSLQQGRQGRYAVAPIRRGRARAPRILLNFPVSSWAVVGSWWGN